MNNLDRPHGSKLHVDPTATLTTLRRELHEHCRKNQGWGKRLHFRIQDRYNRILTVLTAEKCNFSSWVMRTEMYHDQSLHLRTLPPCIEKARCVCEKRTSTKIRFKFQSYILYHCSHPTNRKWAAVRKTRLQWREGYSGANFDIGINTYFTITTALELSEKNNG